MPGAMDQVDLVESLKLEPLVNEQKCLTLLEECSAIDYANKNKINSRILHGYRWLLNQVVHDYKSLNDRVEHDKRIEAEKFEARRNELRQRLAGNTENGYTGLHSPSNNEDNNLPYGDNIIQVSPQPAGNGVIDYFNNLTDDLYKSSSQAKDLTKHVRDQLERHSAKDSRKGSAVKKNKIVPLDVRKQINNINGGDASGSQQIPLRNFENDNSLMLQALTSPVMKKRDFKQRLPPLKIPGTVRPITSKSVGHEGTAWDLDKELEVIDPLHTGRNSEITKVRDFNEVEPS